MEPISIGRAVLETADWDSGEPVVFVQTALTADEMLPVATQPALRDGLRKIVYHRPGYGGSSAADAGGSIEQDAADCCALLDALDIPVAHVVGFSYAAAVALRLTADSPERVRSLVLVEPPPVHTPSGAEFRAACERLLAVRRQRGPGAALQEFYGFLLAPGEREIYELALPGVFAQMERDATTFFDHDIPALLRWHFGASDAARIDRPVLSISGSDSGPFFAEMRALLLDWFPRCTDVVIDGAGHSMALTHPAPVANAIASFLRST